MFRNVVSFYAEVLLTPRPAPKLEDHPFPAVRNFGTPNVVVTATHLSLIVLSHVDKILDFLENLGEIKLLKQKLFH
jgi:hypothetical protein